MTTLAVDVSALRTCGTLRAGIAEALRLLGKQVISRDGSKPSVALTLVEMGRELIGVETALNLDPGVQKLQERIAPRDDAAQGEPASHDYGNREIRAWAYQDYHCARPAETVSTTAHRKTVTPRNGERVIVEVTEEHHIDALPAEVRQVAAKLLQDWQRGADDAAVLVFEREGA
ncbi:MAG: hypothetical protein ACE5JD_07595 [Candidatus Methylomirabilia bacterium]